VRPVFSARIATRSSHEKRPRLVEAKGFARGEAGEQPTAVTRITTYSRDVTKQPTLVGIDGLRLDERIACRIAVEILGAARAEVWDVAPRQGAVDVMLTLNDGRRAAFEVTNLAADGALETANLLAKANHSWPLPGQWFWDIHIGAGADLRRLKRCYEHIILICEAQGIEDPYYDQRGWDLAATDPDLQWLLEDSRCHMMGYPGQPASAMTNPHVMVVPTAGAGPVDDSLTGFSAELQTAFNAAPHIAEHFAKLAREVADEHHLFIPLHDTALPFALTAGLAFGDQLPTDPPPIPAGISHLWLAPPFTGRVLLWSRSAGWRDFFPQ